MVYQKKLQVPRPFLVSEKLAKVGVTHLCLPSTLLAQMSFGLCASLLLFLARSTSLVFAPGLVGTSFLFTVATWVVTFFRFRLVLGPQSQHSKNTDFRQPENTTNNESMPPVLVSERVQFVGRFRVPFRESQSAFKVGPRNINHEGGGHFWCQMLVPVLAPQNGTTKCKKD